MDLSTLAQLVVGGLLLGAVYALAAAGLNLIFGVMRVVNFAHGEFILLGSFITYTLFDQFELNPLLSLLASVPFLFGLGWLLQGLIVNRVVGQPPLMSLVLMWGASLLIANLMLYFFTSSYRSVPVFSGGIDLAGLSVSRSRGAAFVLSVVLSIAVWLFLQRSKWGKAIRATAQSSEMAMVCGIDVRRVRLLTFGLAAAMAGAAGTLLITILALSPGVGPTFLLKSFAIIVIGGLGSFLGAFVGAIVVGLLESFSAFTLSAQIADAVVYFALILFLLFRPSGIMGIKE